MLTPYVDPRVEQYRTSRVAESRRKLKPFCGNDGGRFIYRVLTLRVGQPRQLYLAGAVIELSIQVSSLRLGTCFASVFFNKMSAHVVTMPAGVLYVKN